jgi:hypothetical protein
VEGKSDAQTLWYHGLNAVGVAGVECWKEERDAAELDRNAAIYLVVEPGEAGATLRKKLAGSRLWQRVHPLELPEKDVSALYLRDPEGFSAAIEAAALGAPPFTQAEHEGASPASPREDSPASPRDAAERLARLDPLD